MTPRPTRSFGFNGAVDEHRRSPPGYPGNEHPRRHASMGPSMSIDGVAESPELFLTLWQRFNGAVDEHRRSPETLLRRPRRSPGASMGPSMSIDGVGSTDVTRRRQ